MNPKRKQFKTFVTIAVASLILALILPLTHAINQPEQNLESKASFLISTFNTANKTLLQTIANLKAKAIPIPQESLNAIKEAQALANQSIIFYHDGNFSQAITLAIQALQKIKESLSTLYEKITENQTQQEAGNELTIRLRDAIDRNYALLRGLENMTNSAANYGANVTAIRQKLAIIKDNLVSAASSLDQGNFRQAEDKIADAKSLIDKLTDYFNSFALTYKTERLEGYLNSTEKNLLALRQELDSVSSTLSPNVRAAASAAMTQAQDGLAKAKQYLNSQDISQAIDELTAVKASEEAITNYVNTASSKPTPSSTTSSTSNVNASATVNSALP